MYYTFEITYLKNGVLENYREKRWFNMMDGALHHFQILCDKYEVGPYEYLCSWK